MIGIAADGSIFTPGDMLDEVRRKVLVGLVNAQLAGNLGLLKKAVQGNEPTEAGGVFLRTTQVFKPGGFNFRPTGQNQASDLIMIHRFGHSNRKTEVAGCSFGSQGNSAKGINQRPIDTAPAKFCVFGIRINAVIQYHM